MAKVMGITKLQSFFDCRSIIDDNFSRPTKKPQPPRPREDAPFIHTPRDARQRAVCGGTRRTVVFRTRTRARCALARDARRARVRARDARASGDDSSALLSQRCRRRGVHGERENVGVRAAHG